VKTELHPRNKGNERYDFEELIAANPSLRKHVFENKYGSVSIDFANADAVLELNKALLKAHYEVAYWDIPAQYLCPPIPGRADYIHYLADLLIHSNKGKSIENVAINCLDIGVGSNLIYPLIGFKAYDWSFVGSDIDAIALANAENIISKNLNLSEHIKLRHQENRNAYFEGIIKSKEKFHLTICNPPFHASAAEAEAANIRKVGNLKKEYISESSKNFGGQHAELWTRGGEVKFIKNMIVESTQFTESCLWFTSLVSRKENLYPIYNELEHHKVPFYTTIEMAQGNKISRFVAWSYIDEEKHKDWFK
jgi:23S rRNA (adenine1618-N6)-methyltransferase